MKTICITAMFLFSILILPFDISASCSSQHSCNGCNINFTQGSSDWSYTMDCGGDIETYSGSGSYEGTFCGGEQPCSLPEVN